MKNYTVLGLNVATKKKVELQVTAKNVESVRGAMVRNHPQVLVQAVFPDIQVNESE